ncbi:unnamed protein product [Dibothriocephalus latus]|uniref:Ima1 N-terminal domain-containing protein n=1 Tax=Dibothriocephalus latus TaxID=60516 RepID=A0A3P7P7Q9_DIBLA|nr:unnamed protein product [Dibothriocephalus latus]
MVVHSKADILLMALWFLFLSTLCVLVVQICRWIKNRYVLVHCWFCNSPNRIHVSARNSFVCSACKQYNGFTPSGDYNKEIPEMYQTTGNPSAFVSQSKEAFVSHSNVLCAVCAQKQEQKLLELSRFEASADSKWDVEIEAFRQNLETRFDLCSPCKAKVRARVLQVGTVDALALSIFSA